MRSRQAVYRSIVLAVLAVVLLGALAYLMVLAFQGERLFKVVLRIGGPVVSEHDARPWLIAAAVAGALTVFGWAVAERRLSTLRGAEESERQARAAEEAARRQQHEAEEQRDRYRNELDAERARLSQVVRGWRSEREWNRELREQIGRMQHQQGILGQHDDVRTMVLQLTMSLVEAEKGILLSERGSPGEPLQVVCHIGFDSDPRDSAVAQRFAGEVIARDTTLREDDQRRVDAEKRNEADEEVRNLIAIPLYLSDEFSGVIVCANRDDGFESLDDEVLVAVGDHAGAVLQNSRLHGDLRSAYLSTIRVLASAIELKDPELRGHSDAVSEYVLAVADRLGFEPQRREALIFASLLHDVGKLGISERILLKPAGLTDEERSVIQLHPRIGYQLLRQVPALQEIAPAVLHHHERFDGDGYPGRLRGEGIPLEARIITIADAFSAMTSDRPYSRARPYLDACVELERCAGEQFDPEVVRLFVEEVRRHPPDRTEETGAAPDPEINVHLGDGEFKLGASSFGITDSLTLLYSHRHLHETARSHAQRAALQDRPFSVIVADLVDLAQINLSRGFAEGDAALQTTAGVIQVVAAGCQGLAFRASGRRLALLCPGLDQDAADGVAAELRESLRSGPVVVVTSASWRPGDDGEHVIDRALHPVAPPAAITPPRPAPPTAIPPIISAATPVGDGGTTNRPGTRRWIELIRRRDA